MSRSSRSFALALAFASGFALAPAIPRAALGLGSNLHGRHDARTLLSFHKMFGVDGAFVGEEHPIGGFDGDELPWEIGAAIGRLDTAGNLHVLVRALVFKDDPSVPEELRGINDEDEFRAAVVCLTEEDEEVVERAVVTEGFPATRSGDSQIHAHVELPDPCIAPSVLILAGSEAKWFAVTGFETEEEE